MAILRALTDTLGFTVSEAELAAQAEARKAAAERAEKFRQEMATMYRKGNYFPDAENVQYWDAVEVSFRNNTAVPPHPDKGYELLNPKLLGVVESGQVIPQYDKTLPIFFSNFPGTMPVMEYTCIHSNLDPVRQRDAEQKARHEAEIAVRNNYNKPSSTSRDYDDDDMQQRDEPGFLEYAAPRMAGAAAGLAVARMVTKNDSLLSDSIGATIGNVLVGSIFSR